MSHASRPSPLHPAATVDRAGIFASTVCAIHCALAAFLPGLLAALGLTVWFGETAEYALSAAAILFALSAVLIGWRQHRSWRTLFILVVGISGLLLARYLEEAGVHGVGTAIGIASSALLVFGHILNIQTARH
ncbi:MAG: MerC domain-containing protein [Myxococcota bacterium]